MRTLVLDSGNTATYHVMRTLAKQGHTVHLASSEDCRFFGSRYCAGAHRLPSVCEEERYLRALVDLLTRHSFGLLLFCGDEVAEFIWDHRASLPSEVNCLIPDGQQRAVAFSKIAAYEYAEGIGIPIPKTRLLESPDRLHSVLAEYKFPVVIKGERGSAGNQVRYATSLKEAEARAAEIWRIASQSGRRVCVQEYIPGDGYVVHTLMHHGRPMAICAHRKEREYPWGGGVTSAGTTVHHLELERAALKLMTSLNWHGLAKMDFKRDSRDGHFRFIELDPRISASIDITRVAGCDQIVMACELAAGQPVTPHLSFRQGVQYRWIFPRDAMVMLVEPWRLPAYALGLFSPRTHWDLSPGDVRPFFRCLRQLASSLRHQLRTRLIWRQRREHVELVMRMNEPGPHVAEGASSARRSPRQPEKTPE